MHSYSGCKGEELGKKREVDPTKTLKTNNIKKIVKKYHTCLTDLPLAWEVSWWGTIRSSKIIFNDQINSIIK